MSVGITINIFNASLNNVLFYHHGLVQVLILITL